MYLKRLKKNNMKNWKTTLFGLLAAGCGLMSQVTPQYSGILVPAAAAFTGILGIVAKDGNVTGGTIAATPEALYRIHDIEPKQPSKLSQIVAILLNK